MSDKHPRAPRITQAEFVAGAQTTSQIPPPTLGEIAFAGRSNVGKSSLMNALTHRKNLVRTSSTPGCTRQISFFEITVEGGAKLNLVDLPGYGYAKRSKGERRAWAGLIEGYLTERVTLKAVAILFDLRRGPEQQELDLLELLKTEVPGRPPLTPILVATKADRLPVSKRKLELARIQKKAPGRVFATATDDLASIAGLWGHIWNTFGLQV